MFNIFLDDERFPKNVTWVKLPLVEWVIVRSYNSFIQVIKQRGLPLRISFDHDLSDFDKGRTKNFKERTGMDCAAWLVEYCMAHELDLPIYYVHTMNPIGKENIISLFESYKKSQNID